MTELIGLIVSAVATILGGVWWIVSHIFSKGMDKQHFIEFENNVNSRLDKIDTRIDKVENRLESIRKILKKLELLHLLQEQLCRIFYTFLRKLLLMLKN